MIRAAIALMLFTGLFSCADETLTGYGAADTRWVLSEIDGTAFTATASIEFPEEGAIQGPATCNSFQGQQIVPYPWFKAENIAVTRRACPDLSAETMFLEALQAMPLAEVAGNTLILSNESGRKMVFLAR